MDIMGKVWIWKITPTTWKYTCCWCFLYKNKNLYFVKVGELRYSENYFSG